MAQKRLPRVLPLIILFSLLTLVATSGTWPGAPGNALAKEAEIIATRTTQGYFVRMQTSDTCHALFKLKSGIDVAYFADPGYGKILEKLKGKLLKITFTVQRTRFPVAGGIMQIEVLKSVEYQNKVYKI
jgi:hypothetical protein